MWAKTAKMQFPGSYLTYPLRFQFRMGVTLSFRNISRHSDRIPTLAVLCRYWRNFSHAVRSGGRTQKTSSSYHEIDGATSPGTCAMLTSFIDYRNNAAFSSVGRTWDGRSRDNSKTGHWLTTWELFAICPRNGIRLARDFGMIQVPTTCAIMTNANRSNCIIIVN